MIEPCDTSADVYITEGPSWALPTANLIKAIEKSLSQMGLR